MKSNLTMGWLGLHELGLRIICGFSLIMQIGEDKLRGQIRFFFLLRKKNRVLSVYNGILAM